jgi:hypothetical protein
VAPWLYAQNHPKIPSQKLRWNSQTSWLNTGKNMSASLMFLMMLMLFSYQYYANATWWYVAPWVHSHRFVDFGCNTVVIVSMVKSECCISNWKVHSEIVTKNGQGGSAVFWPTFRLGIPMPELWRMDVWFYMSLGCSMLGSSFGMIPTLTSVKLHRNLEAKEAQRNNATSEMLFIYCKCPNLFHGISH